MLHSILPKPLLKLASLYVADTRYSLAEQLTRIVSLVLLALIVTLLGVGAVIFLSIMIAFELRHYMSPVAAYAIISGGYLLLIGVVFLLRRPLIINPLARLFSKAILPKPKEKTDEAQQ